MTRFGYVMATYFSVLAVGGLSSFHPAPWLIWNATASVPIGLYALHPVDRLQVMDLAAVRPPEPVAGYLADGGYLPKGVLLLKHAIALSGQIVCRIGDRITVDGLAIGEARDRDRLERPLPTWSGCRTLGIGDVFLMNPDVPDSLDGRYFGPLPATSIIGLAVPVLTDEDSSGHFEWFARTR